ncbi:hypothetical protein BKA64DRAFT_205158 [Cadophora sp. MPI-SDFR-AT-0126]|nr:hypothetical protein BKA64DRAFT_205158 [Leotiomycetes sp. MPI-SDFR-AT-0126]
MKSKRAMSSYIGYQYLFQYLSKLATALKLLAAVFCCDSQQARTDGVGAWLSQGWGTCEQNTAYKIPYSIPIVQANHISTSAIKYLQRLHLYIDAEPTENQLLASLSPHTYSRLGHSILTKVLKLELHGDFLLVPHLYTSGTARCLSLYIFPLFFFFLASCKSTTSSRFTPHSRNTTLDG